MIKRRFLPIAWKILALVWLYTEVGQFIQTHSTIGENPLFWPLWICISLNFTMAIHIMDIHLNP